MPVISKNARVSTFDSYSWVGMVSDSTLISRPRKGLAALMNHSISFICCALLSVEGVNSLSTHLLASSTPAMPAGANAAATAKASVAPRLTYLFMVSPPRSDDGASYKRKQTNVNKAPNEANRNQLLI